MNYNRERLGLNTLTRIPALNNAALNHSSYFMAKGASGSGANGFHQEISGRPGFTGITVATREAAAG